MSKKTPRKLSAILGLYFSISVIILTGSILFFTYRLSIQTINTEVEKSFNQKKNIAEDIFELEAERIENNLQSIQNNKKLLNELYYSQQLAAQEKFQKYIDKSLRYNIDVMIITTNNNDLWIDASSPVPDTKHISRELINTSRSLLFSAKILHFSNKEGEKTGIFKAKKLILEDGKVIGILISGSILDNNIFLLDKIKSRTRSLASTLLYESSILVSTDKKEEIENKGVAIEKGQKGHTSGKSFAQYHSDGLLVSKPYNINFSGELSPLYITFSTDDRVIATIKRSYINTIIFISILFSVFLALSFIIIKKLVYPSIYKIIDYTESVTGDYSHDIAIEPGSIQELNVIGSAMEKMVLTIKESNSKLMASEAKYRRLSENSPDVIYRMSLPDGTYEYVSPASTRIFGYPPETWYNNPTLIQNLIHPDFHEYFKDKWALLLKGEVPPSYEYQILHKDEEKRWIHQRNVAVRDKENRLIAIEGIVTDITELKISEKALQDSHRRFLTVLNSIDATIYVVDMNTHKILFMNQNMIDSFGKDMTGEICWDVYRGESGQCDHCPIDKILDKNGNPKGVHVWQMKNPITQKWYINYDRAIEWMDGRIVKLQIATDITEFKRMEEELRQAQKMEAIGTLAGGIAHDFNNILAAIIGYTEMARDDSPSDSTVIYDLDKVLKAANRAKSLVKQILTFSRQGDTECIPIQPSSIVKESIKMLRPSLPVTIEINQNIDSEVGLIFADPTQIHQILMNLGTNAFHAMEETGGKLDISLTEVDLCREDIASEPHIDSGTFIQLSVRDSGPGMTQEVKDKIFDPYFTTKGVGKGTGMGLSIVHGIIKNYGGFITLSSEPGKGTTFHVFLPVIGEKMLHEKEVFEPVPIGKERILFIDDEEILADLGKHMLEKLGYHVTVRNNSIEALETFQNQPDLFDIVITDQTMPGMTGADLARRMIQIRPDIPIVLCTGYSTVISEEKAKSIGIKEFALKPLSKKNLAALIRKVLDNS